jgi:hypothetical protein
MKHLVIATLLAASAAQAQEVYKARLRPVPVDATLARTTTGQADITATLTGSKLAVTGKFQGIQSNATTVKIHQGSAMGVRGNPILDLTVSKAQAGDVSGTVDLTPAQIEALKAGKLYLQLAAEKAPDGNLWGWLTK